MFTSRSGTHLALGGLLAALVASFSGAQTLAPNERYIKPGVNVDDKDTQRTVGLWTLDFKFKDVRTITVNIPGKGNRICWYLWYQVINRTGEPRTFIPQFELVTHDTRMNYRDQILPAAFEAIRKIEDPTDFFKLKNSVSISAEPIPVSLPENKAVPRPVTGVAIWIDPNEIDSGDDAEVRKRKNDIRAKGQMLADSKHFSIFVAGLSNGFTKVDGDASDPRPVVMRKSLQLVFQRPGDKNLMKTDSIRYKNSEWTYRASRIKLEAPVKPTPPKDAPLPKDPPKDD
jgi:hypothetical protein